MKINKQVITEGVEMPKVKETEVLEALTEAEDTSDDAIIDDVISASVDEIADAVTSAAEKATDGKETYSDKKATTIATEIKTHAKGFDAAAWAPLDVASELNRWLQLSDSTQSNRADYRPDTTSAPTLPLCCFV